MQVALAYGQTGLTIRVPDQAVVLTPRGGQGLADEQEAIVRALQEPVGCAPLRDMVRVGDRVVVVFSDITRPMPNARVLPVLLGELGHIPRDDITLLNALGTHRPNTPQELQAMLGADIVRQYAIQQHDAWDGDALVELGRTSFGHRAQVNRTYCEAGFRILTGFIEPHLFAGFSGGPKAVLPGVAGFESIMGNHGFDMLNHPLATWGCTLGNPVWEEAREVAGLTHPEFLLNVTLNQRREITGVFAGSIWEAHGRGVEFVRQAAMAAVDEPFDIVVTSNSGYPLDINLYQAVKGMSCAAQIVRPGGSIIIAAECRDGVPNYGEYRKLVHEAGSVQGILSLISQPGYHRHDQWEAQIQARVQQKAKVYLYSACLSDDETRGMLLHPCRDIGRTLAELSAQYGPQARICVLPEGPQVIPYLASPGNAEGWRTPFPRPVAEKGAPCGDGHRPGAPGRREGTVSPGSGMASSSASRA